MKWNYFDPVFECDAYNREMLKYAPWSGHRRFAYDLAANLKPHILVELGSFYGCSMFAFAQAVKDLHLDTRLYSVDVWEAFDKFTESAYREPIYQAFMEVKEKCFREQELFPMKMTFDQAAEQFGDGSVDLLHIDGSHFYDDVKHDFYTWLPKLKKDSVVLFHDIADEIINGGIMGSHVFWNELKADYPWHMQFDFSCGLGVLFMSENKYLEVTSSIQIEAYQKKENSAAVAMKDELCKMYFQLRDQNQYIVSLKEQIQIKEQHLERYRHDIKKLQEDYETTIQGKDAYISHLEAELGNKAQEMQQDRKVVIDAYEETIRKKDMYIAELEQRLKR